MKTILTFIVLLLSVCCLQAQNTAPIIPVPVKKAVPLIFEKAYLHTDRDVYAQGDTLWFKAYLVNAQNNKPINSSGTLYVELLAPDSAKILTREIIRLDNGLGNGDMELTDTLAPGTYRLRAYTNWMRNFGDNFVFEKNIAILNTQAIPASPGPTTATIKNKEKIKDKKTTVTATTPATATTLTPTVRFYPEGGSLVEGISALVAVKAEDGYGSGIAVNGSILSLAGDTIASFNCNEQGMGLFALLPVKGQTYHAVVDTRNGALKKVQPNHLVFDFPAALSKGLTLQIRQADSVIHAIIRRSGDTSSNTFKPNYSIIVKHKGKTLLNQPLQLQAAQASANIATALLPAGISVITIYDELGKPECERLVYIHHRDSMVNAGITNNKKVYKSKEQVNIQISAPANSNLSMAVIDADIVPEQAGDIVSYLQLKSEVKGNIENARQYFDTTNVNRFKQLDLLLMTQGWRDFVWRRLADTAIRISYAAESAISVPGRVWDEARNKMMPNLNIFLHADGAKGTKQFSAVTDSLGRFHFDGLMIYGKQNVRLAATDGGGKDKGSFMIDTVLPLAVRPHISRPAGFANAVDSAATLAVEKRVESMKNSRIRGITKLKEVTIKQTKTLMTRDGNMLTTWGPDQIFNITPNDYQYKTLEWFIIQNVKGAVESSREFHGIIPTGVEFGGLDTNTRDHPVTSAPVKYVLMPPQLIVNNEELYMNDNTQAEAYRTLYFNMPITKFKKVELRHMAGTLHGLDASGHSIDFNIIIDRFLLYLTLTDNAMIDNPGFLSTDVPGYDEARTFYAPLPKAKSSVADYRTTIHWEPNIKTDATGKAIVSFYNAVPQTDVRVIVQGITSNGTPIMATTNYKVEQN